MYCTVPFVLGRHCARALSACLPHTYTTTPVRQLFEFSLSFAFPLFPLFLLVFSAVTTFSRAPPFYLQQTKKNLSFPFLRSYGNWFAMLV